MARSIRQSTRGNVFDADRPDCYVLDDFENNVTKKSAAITRKVIDFIKELMTGISSDAEIIIVGNKITDTGSVQWLLDTAHNNPEFRVEEIPVIVDGKSAWPDKFVLTDKEKDEINDKIENPAKWVKSLESMKRTMNADGRRTFEQEMLNQPLVEGDRFFDVEKIDQRLAVLNEREYQSTDPNAPHYFVQEGDWKRWYKPDATKGNIKYAVSADVSEGYGIDSSVIQVMDLTNGLQVAEYESNSCPPSVLGTGMVNEAVKLDRCVVCPERNSIGIGVIDQLKALDYWNIFREKTIDRISDKPVSKYGW